MSRRVVVSLADHDHAVPFAEHDGGSFGLVRLVGVRDSPGTPRAQDALGSDAGSRGARRQLYRDGAALAGEAAGRYDPVDEAPRARVSGGTQRR